MSTTDTSPHTPSPGFRCDPFNEHDARRDVRRHHVLGADIQFESDSEALLALVGSAYGGVPPHRLDVDAPELLVELRLVRRDGGIQGNEPPPVRTHSGAGLLCGAMDACNYAMISPERRNALVVVSEDMVDRYPYHVRYELIEFAVFLLASRVLSLVPLHGACVGREGKGVLLLGDSGAGKSTLSLHGLLAGLDFLAEDAVFVHLDRMLATGVGNFFHLREEALRFVSGAQTRAWITESPTIRRRSGVEKYEIDLRHGPGRLAPAPLALTGVVLISNRPAQDSSRLLSRLPVAEVPALLAADQPYAAVRPEWERFVRACQDLGVYRLERGSHPDDGVAALSTLLG